MKKRILSILLVIAVIIALSGCSTGGGTSSGSEMAGKYLLFSADIGDESLTLETLMSMDMAEGTYIEFNADGTGNLYFSGEEPESFKYNESKGEITAADGSIVKFSLKDKKVHLDMTEESGIIMVFALEGSDPKLDLYK